MKFDNSRAFNHLVKRGIVATMRAGKFYKRGRVVKITRHNKIVGRGVIIDVVPNTRENRGKYLDISGFDSVEEWEEEARQLYKGRLPDCIVIVGLMGLFRRA